MTELDLSIDYQRPRLYPKQEAAFFNSDRYSWVEASTKSGKTTGAMSWIIEKALFGKPNQNFWWAAPVYPIADIAYRRVKSTLEPRESFKSNDSKMTITFPTGTVLWFKSGEVPDNLYGEDVYAGVVDEASRMRAESFYALRSTVTKTEAPLRLIGNVKGRDNWFYRGCRQAQSGLKGHSYHEITADDAIEAKIISREEIEDAKRVLPEAVFNELYYNKASDDVGNPFGQNFISACIVPALSDKKPVCFGVDLAKSTDFSAVVGLDGDGCVCVFERFQLPWRETIVKIDTITKDVPTLIDSTGVGDPILEELQSLARNRGRENYEGYKFTGTTKQILMEGLAVAIQSQKIKFPSPYIESELRSFEYQYTRTGVSYSAPAGLHDDCVCALALAVSKYASISKPVSKVRFHVLS